jgi:hypothetical protein
MVCFKPRTRCAWKPEGVQDERRGSVQLTEEEANAHGDIAIHLRLSAGVGMRRPQLRHSCSATRPTWNHVRGIGCIDTDCSVGTRRHDRRIRLVERGHQGLGLAGGPPVRYRRVHRRGHYPRQNSVGQTFRTEDELMRRTRPRGALRCRLIAINSFPSALSKVSPTAEEAAYPLPVSRLSPD